MSYLDTTHELYKEAAMETQKNLCCGPRSKQYLPDLIIPNIMHEMNYGCGTTVHFGDINSDETVLYVGVGGGLEALQFAYFTRRLGSVIAVDRVPEMMVKAQANLKLAKELNSWFQSEFIQILQGDALKLPVPTDSVDIAAQNCLFNIFKEEDLLKALREMNRVLKPGGRLYISDPITTQPIPESLQNDERLRAMCLSGALSYQGYLAKIAEAGFGEIEIRARRPYRVLDKATYGIKQNILLETLELVAYKKAVPSNGADVYAGETATYCGANDVYDIGDGVIIQKGVPTSITQKMAVHLRDLNQGDVFVTNPTYHFVGSKNNTSCCCCCG